jgi:hypothetical protein
VHLASVGHRSLVTIRTAAVVAGGWSHFLRGDISSVRHGCDFGIRHPVFDGTFVHLCPRT